MTIITKPISDKNPDKKGASKNLITDGHVSGSFDSNFSHNDLSQMEMELWLSPSVRRRISATTTVCVFITALLVASTCIIGGVYLYRQVLHHQRMSRFSGWCGIPFEKDSFHFSGRRDYLLGPNKPFFKENDAEMLKTENQFRENFDIDLETGLYERIDVPDFGHGRAGQFIHDFKTNKTGIIDLSSKRCFVLPLDREHIKPPLSMHDLVRKMWMGYYNVNTRVLRRHMKVVQPAIKDLSTQGSYIAHHCANYPTYLIVDVEEDKVNGDRLRRSLAGEEDKSVHLAEFAGYKIIEYEIHEN